LRKEIEKGSIHPPLLNLGQTLILTEKKLNVKLKVMCWKLAAFYYSNQVYIRGS